MEDRCRDVLGDREDHPSYAMMSVSKVSSNVGMPLFGSSIKHRDTIKLTIKRGHVRRRLNQDWYYGNERLIEVEQMEKTVREGKGEIESFFQSRASHYAAHKLVEAGEEVMPELPPVEIDMK